MNLQELTEQAQKSGDVSNLPEFIVVYEKDEDGLIHRKKKRLTKKKKDKGLTDVQNKEIDGAFRLFDKDGSGNIDFYELRDAMRALGLNMSKEEVKKLMNSIDTDNNGYIDEDEFRQLMTQKIKDRNQKEELERAFRIYDQDDTGLIEYYDLKRVADELNEGKKDDDSVNEDVLKGMMYEACGDVNGKINLAQFMRIMKKGKLY
ncbi:hypothetical protein FGO68_gene5355 [Halteria grandinella]|uniref:EF-hand domain-containing protein n=1 Tax=Halteria grandinella TaxID=5974 RepID=A0A8J8NJF4_HALGN|nr:hypothetical protein FGO68_gene5355 [Halteria grandinella]